MKILVLCDQGNNRSVTIAGHLKYWGHDVIPAGIKTNAPETLHMLARWADRIILTEAVQAAELGPFLDGYIHKTQTWDVGPDTYPRPFNKDLLGKVRALMENHKSEFKPTGKEIT